MDRLIYTAMTGAKHILDKQATSAHNLANVNSTGFKAQVDAFRAVPIVGEGLDTRAFVVDSTIGTNFHSGPIQHTGNPLDVAVQGDGLIAIQRPDGSEGYTRNGALRVNQNGVLTTANGMTVMGDGGPVTVPENTTITIGVDGTISSVNNLGQPGPTNIVGRLKLVKPEPSTLVRAEDGLFNTKDGNPVNADETVKVAAGYLEGSNVDVVDEMVNMISLGRQFDLQMKLVQSAKENDDRATQILSLS